MAKRYVYVPETPSRQWDELKAKVPKLLSGTFRGGELIAFEASEPLTDEELDIINLATKKKWRLL